MPGQRGGAGHDVKDESDRGGLERMKPPFYFRAPDYRYTLRSDSAYGWWTGVTRDERQLLVSRNGTLVFDRRGQLLTVADDSEYPIPPEWKAGPAVVPCSVPWPQAVQFEECPLRVRRFWVPERYLGVADMPDLLAEYFTDPDTFRARGDVRAEDALAWRDSDEYVFHCGCDYFMSGRGDVESS
jgi:hypothetical protein